MSNLQITFVVLGIIVIVAIFIYNYWYAIEHTPVKARATEADLSDLTQDRLEPSLRQLSENDEFASSGQEQKMPIAQTSSFEQDPSVSPEVMQGSNSSFYDPLDQKQEPRTTNQSTLTARNHGQTVDEPQEMDALVFSITQILLDTPILGDAALSAQPPTRRVGTKPLTIEGLNLQTQVWEPPRSGAKYSEFQVGVLLANRLGALTEIEFSEFIAKAQAFADAIGGSPDFPDMLHEVARAREVDAFAAQNDAILSFMVIAQRTAWSPGYVNQLAKELGFEKTSSPGRLVVHAARPNSAPVLTLNYDPQAAMANDLDHAPIHEITLTLDVPNVDRSENAFARLRKTVETLAKTMDGIIAAPDGKPLPAMAMDPIATDLEQLYQALDARGIPAGSPAAQKLFS